MATVDLTTETFNDAVSGEGIVIVDFWADWCNPCKRFAPIFEQSSEERGEIVHAKVDTEAEQELAQAFGIRAIPTLMAFRDGVLVYNEAGAMQQQGLQQLISAIEGLDMDQVRAEIAAQEQ